MSADNAVVVLRKTQVQSDLSLSYEYSQCDSCATAMERRTDIDYYEGD